MNYCAHCMTVHSAVSCYALTNPWGGALAAPVAPPHPQLWATRTSDQVLDNIITLAGDIMHRDAPVPDTILMPFSLAQRWTMYDVKATVSRAVSVEIGGITVDVPEPAVVVVILHRSPDPARDRALALTELQTRGALGVRYIVDEGPTWQESCAERLLTPLRMMNEAHLDDAFIECERRLVAATRPTQEAEWGRRVAEINAERSRRFHGGVVQYTYPMPSERMSPRAMTG